MSLITSKLGPIVSPTTKYPWYHSIRSLTQSSFAHHPKRPASEKEFKFHLKPRTDETYKVQTWASCIPNNQVSLVSFYLFAHSLFTRCTCLEFVCSPP